MGALLGDVKDKFGDRKAHLCMIINSYQRLDAYNQLHPGLTFSILLLYIYGELEVQLSSC